MSPKSREKGHFLPNWDICAPSPTPPEPPKPSKTWISFFVNYNSLVLAIFELKLWKSENPYKGSPYKSAQEPEKARFGHITLKLISVENFDKVMIYVP